MKKISRLKTFSCASMIILSCTLVGCTTPEEETEATNITEEKTSEESIQDENVIEEDKGIMDHYMDLPIYNDKDRAAFQDIKESFEGTFDTSSIENYKEEIAMKINYFKRFIQNDPEATYGGYTFGELSEEAQQKLKELYYKIDCYFSEHIDSYDELKESVKSGTQKVIERGKNGWERFKDNEGKEIKEKASQWIDKYFPEDY